MPEDSQGEKTGRFAGPGANCTVLAGREWGPGGAQGAEGPLAPGSGVGLTVGTGGQPSFALLTEPGLLRSPAYPLPGLLTVGGLTCPPLLNPPHSASWGTVASLTYAAEVWAWSCPCVGVDSGHLGVAAPSSTSPGHLA